MGSVGGAGRSARRARWAAVVVVGAWVGGLAPPAAGAEQAGTGAVGPSPRRPVELLARWSVASDINDHGVVVGWYVSDADGVDHAFRRSARGRVTDLGPGLARAVNDRGVAVGERQDENAARHATRWGADGRAHDLGLGPDSWASDVNDHGAVVGYVGTPLGYRAFVAEPGAAPALLPHPAGIPEHQDIPTAINERGDIAGFSVSAATGDLAPVVWRGRAHTPTLLPAPNLYQDVTGINERGTVVGTASTEHGYQMVIWTGRDHHEVPIGPPGALGRAINDRGQVAGVRPDTGEVVRWDPRTGRTTILEGLAPFGWAYGMNNVGAVVGYSTMPDFSPHATLFSIPRRPPPHHRRAVTEP